MKAALGLAIRDLRGGRSGLALLFACLALSVASIAAVASLADSIRSAIGTNGRLLIGADLVLSVAQREATAAERQAIDALGPAVKSVTTRTNAVAADGQGAPVELRGIEAGWPPVGAVELGWGRLAATDGEAAVGSDLAERLSLAPGAVIRIGYARFTVVGMIRRLPTGSGFFFAPPVLITPEGLERTRLIQPGSLSQTAYRLLLPDGSDPEAVGKAFQQRFPDGGWNATDRTEAAGGTRRFIAQVEQLLMLIALAGLAVGGLGIASAARAFAASRQRTIAIFKMVGASRSTVAMVLLVEVGVVGGLALLLGLSAGALVPRLSAGALEGWLPVALDRSPQWRALGIAAAYGLLITVAASWRPLSGAVRARAAGVFRQAASGDLDPMPRAWLVPLLALALAVALALASARDPLFAAAIVAGLAVTAGLFALLGLAIKRLSARAASGRGPLLRLGIAALDRPGSATVRLSVAMGLGLSLLTLLSAVGTGLLSELDSDIAKRAPALFLADLPKEGRPALEALVDRHLPGSAIQVVPTLRGRVTEVDGVKIADLDIPDGGWIVRGDRGLTFAGELPPGNRILAGQWWPSDYAGPPLVSLEAESAGALGLDVGDTLTVTVLGRPIEARIASLREVDWRSLGFNFGILFAPGALESAPFTLLATVSPPSRDAPLAPFERALSNALPQVSAVRVGEIVDRVRDILVTLEAAIRLATGAAIAIAAVVLAGSVIATRQQRQRESVLLKLLGASRGQVIAVQGTEFAILCLVVAFTAFFIGVAGGWAVMTLLFEIPFRPDWLTLIAAPAAATVLMVAAALGAALPALLARPAQALRAG